MPLGALIQTFGISPVGLKAKILFTHELNHPDNFTALQRLATNNTSYNDAVGFYPYGSDGQPMDPQPFAVENIILLTDGDSSEMLNLPRTFYES